MDAKDSGATELLKLIYSSQGLTAGSFGCGAVQGVPETALASPRHGEAAAAVGDGTMHISELTLSFRPDGSPWFLGAGNFGTVRTGSCPPPPRPRRTHTPTLPPVAARSGASCLRLHGQLLWYGPLEALPLTCSVSVAPLRWTSPGRQGGVLFGWTPLT